MTSPPEQLAGVELLRELRARRGRVSLRDAVPVVMDATDAELRALIADLTFERATIAYEIARKQAIIDVLRVVEAALVARERDASADPATRKG